MPRIFLEEWAAKRGVGFRTAQAWAKNRRIPAKLDKARVLVERSIKKYMIDADAPLPE